MKNFKCISFLLFLLLASVIGHILSIKYSIDDLYEYADENTELREVVYNNSVVMEVTGKLWWEKTNWNTKQKSIVETNSIYFSILYISLVLMISSTIITICNRYYVRNKEHAIIVVVMLILFFAPFILVVLLHEKQITLYPKYTHTTGINNWKFDGLSKVLFSNKYIGITCNYENNEIPIHAEINGNVLDNSYYNNNICNK